ncbi:MAG TPA: alanine dehydrogenase [Candidatus Polarisedimenticolia bacterium]|jgi:alanine dehydrogenase|nr:alanine dehydrogenase [Candidatus Polarisedimenticolia bacterium]
MQVGVPTEIKDHEYRVSLVPAGVHALVQAGHQVLVQDGAGLGSGIDNAAYQAAGAVIVTDAAAVYRRADLVLKVKEPLEEEIPALRRGQILFTYLHLAPQARLTRALVDSGVTAIAYETITDGNGHLPLLTPMSEVAGRMSIQVGAFYLQKTLGGRGILLGGVPGVPPGDVVILGGGTVGINAAMMALGLGARVTIVDRSLPRLRDLDQIFHGQVVTIYSTGAYIAESVRRADLLIGAVLVPGDAAPRLVTRDMVGTMKKGAVIVDVAVDQGGCIETTRPTTHSSPTYEVDGVIHYCVANMPGAVPRTSTFALTNATLAYVLRIANRGFQDAVAVDPSLRAGVNLLDGKVTHEAVARSQGLPYVALESLL